MDVFNVGTPILQEIADTLKKVAEPPQSKQETRGAKVTHPWDRAISAVWAKIASRGEVTRRNQAEVERLLAEWFMTNCGNPPAAGSIRESGAHHLDGSATGMKSAGN
jgi:hypothetical protein